MTISAEEARKASKENEQVEIQTFIESIDARIQERILVGKTNMEFTVIDSNKRSATPSQKEAIKTHYAKHGYKFVEHTVGPSPDPRERDWTEINWS